MKNTKPVITGIGEVLWDVFPEGRRAGGAPVNFVYHASRFGAEGYALTAVGNDLPGKELLNELKKNKINAAASLTPYPTGQVTVKLDANGVASYEFLENCAWDHIPFTEQAAAVMKKSDAVSFGTLASRCETSRKSIIKLIDAAGKDTLKLFDVNLRQKFYSKEIMETFLKKSDILKMNEEEMKILGGLYNVRGAGKDVCRFFAEKYSLKYVIFTAGKKYSRVYSQNGDSVIKTPKVKVVDTVGAGDAFSGAFIHAILSGKNFRTAHKKAAEAAAFVCKSAGAWPGYGEML